MPQNALTPCMSGELWFPPNDNCMRIPGRRYPDKVFMNIGQIVQARKHRPLGLGKERLRRDGG